MKLLLLKTFFVCTIIMNYEWDEKKRIANQLKHEVDFNDIYGFDWELAVVEQDKRKEYGEPRFIASGYIGSRLYVVVFTKRNGTIRLISFRKANPREVVNHEKKTGMDIPGRLG